MRNASNEYKNYVSGKELPRTFRAKSSIKLANSEVLHITENDIVEKGMSIYDSVSPSGNFQLGSAIINQCDLMLNNVEGKFSEYDFTGAIIVPSMGLELSTITEWFKMGEFTVDESLVAASIINLTALDNMSKFDIPLKDLSISYPITVFNLLHAVCLHCGVPLSALDFTNKNFIIERPLNDEAVSCREIISWIAQLSGTFARCNSDGALELKWYDMSAFEQSDNLDGGKFDKENPYSSGDIADGGNFTNYNAGDSIDGGTFLQSNKYHHIYALDQARINTDDIIITGVQVKAMGTQEDYGETVLFGSAGYVIEIKDNYLIQEGNAAIIANSVGSKIVGMRFRPMDISALMDITREGGDVAYVSHKNSSYQTVLTRVKHTIGLQDAISCDAESPSRKQSQRFSAETKAIIEARRQAKNQLTEYDLAVQQLNSLMTNAMGYYPVREEQEDGSYIDYMCDKPTLEESQIIWKKSINGFAISTDGGETWTSGFTADGNIIAKTLSVIGINAEWIKVLTSFTVGDNFSVDAFGRMKATNAELSGKITSDEGQIGPFKLDEYGLKSRLLEFMERDSYPLIWLTKPAKDSSLSPGDGWSRANYEPDVTVLRNIDGDTETSINLIARHRPDVNKNGTISIYKTKNGQRVSNLELDEDGLMVNKGESFINLNHIGLTVSDFDSGDGFMIISAGGGLFIQSQGVGEILFLDSGLHISSKSGTPIYLNGTDVKNEINNLYNRLNTAENEIANIKIKLGMI